jgi:dTMP kinase
VAEVLNPALAAGEWLLLDRFVDSSLAYQGGGRGLGVPEIAALNEFATQGLTPDLTLLLRVDPATGRARLEDRGAGADRLEREADAFFGAVAAAYDALAADHPGRYVVIDASAPADAVLADAVAAAGRLLQSP